MTGDWPADLVAVAEVLSPQGNRGEVKAASLTRRSDRFGDLRSVTAWKDGVRTPLTLRSWRAWHDFVILGFAEISSISAAELLRGARICIPKSERESLPPNEYYQDDLVGLTVVTEAGQPLGRIVSVMTTGANDVLVVRDSDRQEVLLPAVAAVIVRVDLAAGVLVANPPPGLLD